MENHNALPTVLNFLPHLLPGLSAGRDLDHPGAAVEARVPDCLGPRPGAVASRAFCDRRCRSLVNAKIALVNQRSVFSHFFETDVELSGSLPPFG